MSNRLGTAAFVALMLGAASSCSDNGVTNPLGSPQITQRLTSASQHVVISQVYGGGGNSGATIKNDFIEIYNASAGPVNLTGWSVQYASAAGTTWQTTALSGTIQSGQYYLVQEGAGSGGTVLLVPDASGSIGMSGTVGKVALVNSTVALSGTQCTAMPAFEPAASVVDFVGFGSTANCSAGLSPTAAPSNTRSIFRGDNGSQDTNNNGADFSTGTPNPRNTSSPNVPPTGGGTTAPVLDHVTISGGAASVFVGSSIQFSALGQDASNGTVAGTTTWTSSNTAAATVDNTGKVTGVATSTTPVTITATVVANGVTKFATTSVTVGTSSVIVPSIRLSEIHYDNSGTDVNEKVEVEGPAGTDLTGWSIVLYNGTVSSFTGLAAGQEYATINLSGTLGNTCSGRGAVAVDFTSVIHGLTGTTAGIENGPDGFALVSPTGLVELLSYRGSSSTGPDNFTATSGPANGVTSSDIGVFESANPGSLQRSDDGTTWSRSATSSFGFVNGCGAPPAPVTTLSFSGRDASSDPALPIGFEAQIFATYRVNGTSTFTTITWSSDTPAIASIDANGVVHSLAAGAAILRATTPDGTTATYSLPMTAGVRSVTAQYGNNLEFGTPTDNDASNDYLLPHAEYTSSYSSTRNTINWVSFRLDASTYGAEDRCNCFTQDPLLPASFPHFTTADYTGAGSIAGYGIDRGHMARSADRTAASLDNATTYYLSNIVPQAADQNQGPWAVMENYLGNLAENQSKNVYVIAGVAGNKGTVKNLGQIVIPEYTWKVAVIMPRGLGVADVHSASDLEVIAVVMPNVAGVRNVDWNSYRVTVDSVESLSGYDLLNLLPDNIERAVEANDKPPVAVITGLPASSAEGSLVSFDASASTDPDDGIASYSWDLGNGVTDTRSTFTRAFDDNGTYTVTLTVTDTKGVSTSTSQTITVSNVAPSSSSISAASGTYTEGQSVMVTLARASDPSPVDASSLLYTIDCGTGAGFQTAAADVPFACVTTDNGTLSIRGRVSDKDGGVAEYSTPVDVSNVAPVASFTAPATDTEGSAFSLSLTDIIDPSSVDAAGLVFAFDCGTGFVPASSPSVTCATDDNGTRNVRASVTDKDGGQSIYSATVEIANVAPIGRFVSPSSLVEGSSFTLSLVDLVDPSTIDAASLVVAYDCGSGAGYQASSTCSTDDNGTRIVKARVTDKDGGASEYTASVSITNAAPVIGSFATPAAPVSTGALAQATVTFSDAGTADTHSAVITWGDGATSTVNAGLTTSATASHAYTTTGFYTVSVTVTDKDGASASSTSSVIVYAQAAGWLQAKGSLVDGSGKNGKSATQFDLDIRYTGGMRPTGSIAFTNGGAVDLTTSSIDYLVIEGQKATVRASGVLRDGTAVTITLVGLDGKTGPNTTNDRLRIRIVSTATGAVVYDNEPGAAVGASPTGLLQSGKVDLHK